MPMKKDMIKRPRPNDATRKKAPAKKASKRTSDDPSVPLVHRINILLHTMRSIEQHEPQLCTLMNEVRSTGSLTSDVRVELITLLDQMPQREYTDDLEAVLQAVNPRVKKGHVKNG